MGAHNVGEGPEGAAPEALRYEQEEKARAAGAAAASAGGVPRSGLTGHGLWPTDRAQILG